MHILKMGAKKRGENVYFPEYKYKLSCISAYLILFMPTLLFSGFLRDFTGSFNASFYLMGATLILSGSILFLEPFCRKIEIRKIVGVSVESQIEVHHL